jgi:hypothetical protein
MRGEKPRPHRPKDKRQGGKTPMKAGRTLQELAVELQRQASAKRDFIVNTQAMMMEETAELFSITKPLESGMREVNPFAMTDLFHRQLGGVLDIPSKYYDRMRKEQPGLLHWNVNWWLGKMDSTHMVRTLDNTARAFLSNRYRRLDNYEIAQAVLPVFSEMRDARVDSCEITENRMYLKVVNTRMEAQVVPGDIVQAGVMVSNSEVGLGSVSVMPLVYRLVCSSGMIVNDLGQRKLHVGRMNEESWELFSDQTIQADDTAFMMKLADITRTALDEARFNQVVDRLRQAAEAPLTAPVSRVVEITGKTYGFTQNEQDNIMFHLIAGGELSLYGLGNAVTRASQDVESYDRATDMERTGWTIANMPRNEWLDLNA